MKVKVNRNAVRAVVILLAVLLLAVSLFRLLALWEEKYKTSAPSDGQTERDRSLTVDGVRYLPNDDLKVILLIGVDKFKHETQSDSYTNSQQADFLTLLLLDEKNAARTAVQLNRDTMTDIQMLGVRGENAGKFVGQLALSHTYGSGREDSCRNTVKAVSELLYDIKIDNYIAFTMDAVAKVNDLVGGVTVEVQDDLSSVSPDMVKGATVTLKGDAALKYVRARSSLDDSSNISRMKRQRQYLSALQTKVSGITVTDGNFMHELLDTVSEYMVSDCTADQLSRIYESWERCEDKGIRTVDGEAKKGETYLEFYPDKEGLKRLVAELFCVPSEKR